MFMYRSVKEGKPIFFDGKNDPRTSPNHGWRTKMTDTNGIINLRIMCLGEIFICFQIRDNFTFIVLESGHVVCKSHYNSCLIRCTGADSHLIIGAAGSQGQTRTPQCHCHRGMDGHCYLWIAYWTNKPLCWCVGLFTVYTVWYGMVRLIVEI